MAYQNFSDRPGGSKSDRKLEALRLPASLKGKRVLDIGCNEGFFCLEAKRRGAAEVMGIDKSPKAIEAARDRASREGLDIRFEVLDAMGVTGEWDCVLLLSALHYMPDPAGLFQTIHKMLSPGGVLIFEGGIATELAGKTLQRAFRSIDERYFPSLELMKQVWLRDFSVGPIRRSVNQGGDPVNRYVLHCRPVQPTVVFVTGEPDIGKSSLADELHQAVRINTDAFLRPKRREKDFKYPPFQERFDKHLSESESGKNIRYAWDAVRTDPDALAYFAGVVADAVALCRSSRMIVVEGYSVTDLQPLIERALGKRYRFWSATRD